MFIVEKKQTLRPITLSHGDIMENVQSVIELEVLYFWLPT